MNLKNKRNNIINKIKIFNNKLNNLYSKQYNIKINIEDLNKNYKNSFKKYFYLQFKNIKELCDYRLEIIYKQLKLYDSLEIVNKNIENVTKNLILMYNELTNIDILINK